MGFLKGFCTAELSTCCHSEPVSESVGGSRRWFQPADPETGSG